MRVTEEQARQIAERHEADEYDEYRRILRIRDDAKMCEEYRQTYHGSAGAFFGDDVDDPDYVKYQLERRISEGRIRKKRVEQMIPGIMERGFVAKRKRVSMNKIERIAEGVIRRAAMAMVLATSTDGMIEMLLDVTNGFIQIGMGGEWWNGQIRPGHNTLHHKKEHFDEACKPVSVDIQSKGYQVVIGVSGGLGYEHNFTIGAK
jgi:hypothetical protein